MKRKPVLVIHGGTGNRPDDKRLARIRQRLRAICRAAYGHLQHHAALDSVIYAVSLLEDDPLFNAGTGSSLQRDGKVRMSASVMDGDRLRFSAVLNIERVKNPVLVAKALLESSDRIVAGSHATSLARRLGFPVWNPVTPERLRQ
ncbi:MAG: isoaspartyl peptidase/L-asparaginase [Candidatus Omnitrophica bacterium]|nr:isoaspartyl peptidase/L-asparaginase [Candidatus Omnitrophota bacterium]